MALELTIRRRGSLLSRVLERQITEAQATMIEHLLLVTDYPEGITYPEFLTFIHERADARKTLLGHDAPVGAGESVEAYRG